MNASVIFHFFEMNCVENNAINLTNEMHKNIHKIMRS